MTSLLKYSTQKTRAVRALLHLRWGNRLTFEYQMKRWNDETLDVKWYWANSVVVTRQIFGWIEKHVEAECKTGSGSSSWYEAKLERWWAGVPSVTSLFIVNTFFCYVCKVSSVQIILEFWMNIESVPTQVISIPNPFEQQVYLHVSVFVEKCRQIPWRKAEYI